MENYYYPDGEIDLNNSWIQRGPTRYPLKPKAAAMLQCLLIQAGNLVTKETLLRTVWPRVIVGKDVLRSCLRELRNALGDDARQPRFIETVPRRGYRWIAPLSSAPPGSGVRGQGSVGELHTKANDLSDRLLSSPPPAPWPPAPVLVGRAAELAQLQNLFAKAASGERQLVFVTGEPGIGKTALLEALRAPSTEHGARSQNAPEEQDGSPELSAPSSVLPAPCCLRGQCIEQYGRSEAYLPVLDALSQLAHGPEAERLQTVLEQVAPLWLLQLPMLLNGIEVPALHAKAMGATQDRMLREFAAAVELLTREQPLVLILEDLHWSDHATVELLAFLARRQSPTRLLILGTYRPVDLLHTSHPLRSVTQELQAHSLCTELPLSTLCEADIETYLHERFPHSVLPTRLAEVLYHRTEGNPLFLVSVIQDLITHEQLVEEEGRWRLQGDIEAIAQLVPAGIRQLVARQRERLPSDHQHLLAAASIAGHEFATATVAAVIERPLTEVETHCQQLAERQQFLHPAGISAWPDGTTSARYRFQHALYQQLWHERVPISTRQDWHLKIGERLEVSYNGHAPEIATELAVHFEQGRAYHRAIPYYQHAAQNALRRSANQEAIEYLQHGLSLLQHLPESPERTQLELPLQVALSTPLLLTKGYTDPEVEQVCTRARRLCQGAEDSPQLFPAVFALFRFYIVGGQLLIARELANQLLRITQQDSDSLFLPAAHTAVGGCLFHSGDLPVVLAQVERAIACYDFQRHGPLIYQFGEDTALIAHSFAAWTLPLLGYPEQAREKMQEIKRVAEQFSLPFIRLEMLFGLSVAAALLGEWSSVLTLTRDLRNLAGETLPLWTWLGGAWQGYALAARGQIAEGLALMKESMESLRLVGLTQWRSHHLGLLADVQGKAGQVEEGLNTVTEALTKLDNTEERWCEAELWRIKGELTLQQASQKSNGKSQTSKVTDPRPLAPDPHDEAETCFLKAITIAQKQEAKSWELRATMSLVRLRQQQAREQREKSETARKQEGEEAGRPEARSSRPASQLPSSKLVEAHQMLSAVYNWFTEGFDTVDLQEAKALLEELGY